MLSFALDPYDFDYIESIHKSKKKKEEEIIKEKIKEHDVPTKKDKVSTGGSFLKQASAIDLTPSRIQPPKKKKKNIVFD